MNCLKTYNSFKVNLLDIAGANSVTIATNSSSEEDLRKGFTRFEEEDNKRICLYDPETVLEAGKLFFTVTPRIWKTTFIKKIDLKNGEQHEANLLKAYIEDYKDKLHTPTPMIFTGKVVDNSLLSYGKNGRGVRPWKSKYLIQFLLYDNLFFVPSRPLFLALAHNTLCQERWPDNGRMGEIPEKHLFKLRMLKDGN